METRYIAKITEADGIQNMFLPRILPFILRPINTVVPIDIIRKSILDSGEEYVAISFESSGPY